MTTVEPRNINEAIGQVESCICSLNYQNNRSTRKEAKDVLQIIKKNLPWEEYSNLKERVILLQSLIFQLG